MVPRLNSNTLAQISAACIHLCQTQETNHLVSRLSNNTLTQVYPGLYYVFVYINVRENQKTNQEWTNQETQATLGIRHKTKTNKIKKHNAEN
jgi:disulfide oxidoreductase YuzD